MDPLNSRVEATFDEALTHSNPEARDAFLKEACAEDGSLEAVVRRMLQAHEEADAFGALAGHVGRNGPQHQIAQHHRLEQAPYGPKRQSRSGGKSGAISSRAD